MHTDTEATIKVNTVTLAVDVQTGAVDDGTLVLVLAATRWESTCGHCGQPITRGDVGPMTWLDDRTGQPIGAHDHQHGCGAWNAPTEARCIARSSSTADLDDALADALADLQARVAAEAADAVRAVRARLAADLDRWDDEDEPTGDEIEPGCWIGDDGTAEAWAYHPLSDGDCIVITRAAADR